MSVRGVYAAIGPRDAIAPTMRYRGHGGGTAAGSQAVEESDLEARPVIEGGDRPQS